MEENEVKMIQMEDLENTPVQQAMEDLQEEMVVQDVDLTDNDKSEAMDGAISNDMLRKLQMRMRKPIQQVRKFDKVGRNDPCPCGSGQKYKKCCMSTGRYEGLENKH